MTDSTKANHKQAYQAAYEKLRGAYITRLNASTTILETTLRSLDGGSLSQDALVSLQSLAHGLSGSGTTFGFPEVSETGRALDIYLDKVIKNSPQNDLEEKVTLLKQACEKSLQIVNLEKSDASFVTQSNPDGPAFDPQNVPHVLIIDDDKNLREMISIKLKQHGFYTSDVGSAQEMQTSISLRRPDIVILDVGLPGNVSGHDILRQIKKDPNLLSIPVLMLTASAKEQDVVAALHNGAAGYIVKPVDTNVLVSRVEKLCREMRQTVLIADNDPLILALLDHKFKEKGFNVVLTDNGLSTFGHIQSSKPDLVILDIVMPGIDGLSVLQMLRNDPVTKNIPVIVASAKNQESDIKAGRDAGANDYVVKPFSADDLIARSFNLLKKTGNRNVV